MDTARNLLFEVAPDERDGQKRKHQKRHASTDEKAAEVADSDVQPSKYEGETDTFLVPLLKQCPCIQCNYPGSLIYVASIRGRRVWKMQCEWCLIRWDGEPVDGVLEEHGDGGPVMRDGKFIGKNFREIEDAGDGWYIEGLARKSSNKWIKKEAQKWLSAKKPASG